MNLLMFSLPVFISSLVELLTTMLQYACQIYKCGVSVVVAGAHIGGGALYLIPLPQPLLDDDWTHCFVAWLPCVCVTCLYN